MMFTLLFVSVLLVLASQVAANLLEAVSNNLPGKVLSSLPLSPTTLSSVDVFNRRTLCNFFSIDTDYDVDTICPQDLSTFRSDTILKTFSPDKLQGMWYEMAYHDIAQIKETCQSYNRIISDDKTQMEEVFGFTYAKQNITSALHLQVDFNGTFPGLYTRYINKPIVNKMRFPSVVVDAIVNSKHPDQYDAVAEYLCYRAGPVAYREIRIGARSPTYSELLVKKLENNMKTLGIQFKMLQKVEHTADCTYVTV